MGVAEGGAEDAADPGDDRHGDAIFFGPFGALFVQDSFFFFFLYSRKRVNSMFVFLSYFVH